MGGAEDLPKRASSPLKRPAADLEPEDSANQAEDVDMITVLPSDSQEAAKTASQLPRSMRAQSVNMFENEAEPAASGKVNDAEAQDTTRPKSPASGT